VVNRATNGQVFSLEDGLGFRRIARTNDACNELLELAPALSAQPLVEEAIRDQAACIGRLNYPSVTSANRIERGNGVLRIVSEIPPGIRLSDLLEYLGSVRGLAPEPAIFELVTLVINAVAALHAHTGGLAHGAISPAHVLLADDGRVVLTDCVFGPAFETLQCNREQLWKEFGLAMPAAASLSRFDQQTDVTQMGALVLAIALRRPLRLAEYPHDVPELILEASKAFLPGMPMPAPDICTWFQKTLQVHPRLAFRSAVEAQRSFIEITSTDGGRPPGAMALQMLVNAARSKPLP